MSLITRCPDCATLFRVVPDQLRISGGWVRCGQCKHVFDATQHMLPEAQRPAPAPTPPVTVAQADARTPARSTAAARRSAQDVPDVSHLLRHPDTSLASPPSTGKDAITPAPTDAPAPAPNSRRHEGRAVATASASAPTAPAASVPQPPPRPAPSPRPSSGPAPTPPAVPSATSPAFTPSGFAPSGFAPSLLPTGWGLPPAAPATEPVTYTEPVPAPTPTPATPPAVLKVDFEISDIGSPFPDANPPSAAPPVAPARPAPAAAASSPHPADDHKADRPAPSRRKPSSRPNDNERRTRQSRPTAAATDSDATSTPSFVAAARQRAFWASTKVRVLAWTVALLLLLTLLLQVALTQRHWLAARAPATAPLLHTLCQHLGCQIQPHRQLGAVLIDNSAFVRINDSQFRLSFTLQNQADMPIATPALELTLHNNAEQTLLRRVLLPQELAAPDTLPALGEFNGLADIHLDSAAQPTTVTGYHLVAFYP